MPYDSQGNFTRVYSWEQDRLNDIGIMSDRHDEEDDNFAAGFNECFLRDGRAVATGNFKMGNFKITGLGDAQSANDAVNKSQLDSLNSSLSGLITTKIDTMLSALYPVGSVYIGTQTTCPLASLIAGSTWVLVAQNRALWGGDGTNANTTINAGLPNITGTFGANGMTDGAITTTGAFKTTSMSKQTADSYGGSTQSQQFGFDASQSSSIYGASTTVQPPAYRVNVWRRTA